MTPPVISCGNATLLKEEGMSKAPSLRELSALLTEGVRMLTEGVSEEILKGRDKNVIKIQR